MDKCKWPSLCLSTEVQENENLGVLTQEDSLLPTGSNGEGTKDLAKSHQREMEQRDQGMETSAVISLEEEDLMDNISVLSKNSDMDEDGQGW